MKITVTPTRNLNTGGLGFRWLVGSDGSGNVYSSPEEAKSAAEEHVRYLHHVKTGTFTYDYDPEQ